MSSEEANSTEQASAVPYRRRNGRIEFCLITSMGKGRWGFPKGIIDPGETAIETALKEAEEEAGIYGRIEGKPLGQYEYRKWGTVLTVTGYLMRVTAAEDDWEEAQWRERAWYTADKARAVIDRDEILALLEEAVGRVAGQEG